MNYNISTHPLPINWFNSKMSHAITLGQNEKIIKNTIREKYPENSVCVKVDGIDKNSMKINRLSVTFVGDFVKTSYSTYLVRRRIDIFKSYEFKNGVAIHSKIFDKIAFCGLPFSILDIREKLDYIDYILHQVRAAGLE